MGDAAEPLRRKLQQDLLLAMKAKDLIAVSALRSVMSALDNASAVAVSTGPILFIPRNVEVPRKNLSAADCRSILDAEIGARARSAAEYARLGRDDVAARMRAEQAVIERYVGSSLPNTTEQGAPHDASG